jgi:hypothetical protein
LTDFAVFLLQCGDGGVDPTAMGKILNLTILATVSAAAAVSAPAIAAPPSGPSGSIAVASTDADARTAADTGLQYDGTVAFDTSVDGKISKQARVYVRVLCWQGDDIVFQYSADPDFQFPLIDQAGQGLEWNGEDASCEASLIYRVEKGRSVEMSVLDTTWFDVAGSTLAA